MRLTALHCGDQVTDEGLLLHGLRSNTYRRIPIMAYLVETSAGVIVWDTGMCTEVMRRAVEYVGPLAKRVVQCELPEGGDTVSRLEQAGYDTGDVHLVLNSHLHFDHAGMNQSFPAARVLLRQRELLHAETLMDTPSSGFIRNDFYSSAAELVTFEYEDRHEVAPGLSLVSTPGHTPGHQCLVLRFPSGTTFVLSGDAVYSTEMLDEGSIPGFRWDEEKAYESVRTLQSLREAGARVLVCHEPRTRSHEPLELIHAE